MSSEEKAAMNILINWFNNHPQAKKWGWFFLLWIAGLATAVILTYPIKLLFQLMKR